MHLCKRPAALFISVIAPMLGVFLVIRRQSLMADTLSHVSLAGVALGFFLVESNLMTLIVVIVAAIILEYLRMIYSTYSEISIAILMSGGLALALVLMNLTGGNSAAVFNRIYLVPSSRLRGIKWLCWQFYS